MITKDNFKLYESLFNDINKKLTEAGLITEEISDINEYFMELEQIKRYVMGNSEDESNPQRDPYFLILPMDEGLFEIKANTREIVIPDDFKGGVGVQGDELAEIVYFSIDRYFDTTDLYNKEIFVQWEAPNGDKGLSVCVNKTLLFEPGKVVFGWPITSEITKNAGNVKFAVRFYERIEENNKKSLRYSFSTKTNMIKINPSLDFIIDDEDAITAAIINKNKLIYENLRNSQETEALDFPAVEPTFDYSNFNPSQENEYDLGETFLGRALFTEEDDENGIGVISYYWKKKKENTVLDDHIADKPLYVDIDEDEVKNKYDTYYIYDSISKKYSPYLGNLPAEEGIKVYKLYASLTPDSAGDYYLVASNRAGRGNVKEVESEKPWKITFASIPELTYSRNVIMNNEFKEKGINVDAVANGVLTYQWLYKNQNNDYVNIDGQTNNILKDAELAEGYYAIKVKNVKNNDEAEIISEPIRVTNPAEPVNIGRYTVDGQEIIPTVGSNYYISMNGVAHTINVALTEILPPSDNITYQWYNQNGVAIDGATSSSYTVSDVGIGLYVVITNTYNTDTATTESCHFVTMLN